jgi:UDP-glucose 4-epimerase
MTRHVLVTGGAGFIGSHLVAALLARGDRVRVLDDFSSGKTANLADVVDRVEVMVGDAADRECVLRAVAGVDVVFHEAAIASVQRSVDQPLASHRANLESTVQLLTAAVAARVSRFVFAASSAAYGNDPTLPKHESMLPDPPSPYAAQKLASEHYLAAFAQSFGLHTVALRYFNVYGPRQDPSSPYSGVISRFTATLLEGRRPVIFGDGEQTRDFVFVEDVVRANLLAAERDVYKGAVVNVATGRQVSVNRLFETVRDAIGGAALHVEPERRPARAGEVRHSVAEVSRARDWLGFESRIALEDGIRRTVECVRKEVAS